MERPIMPKDIKRYVKISVAKRLIKWFVLTSIIVLFIVFFGERCFSKLESGKYFLYLLLIIAPIFILKLYKLIDRSWCGVIEKIEIKYATDSDRAFKPSLETLYTKEVVFFHIRLSNGKLIVKRAFENRATPHNASKLYKQGDKVIHLYGTDHIQILGNNQNKICVVCGTSNPNVNHKCISCNSTLTITLINQ